MSDATLERRTHVYVQRPNVYEISGCCKCGNSDPDWSEYKGYLWCQNCQIDFKPDRDGVFGGPICCSACEMIGIYFDRINLETGQLEPDPNGKFHFSVSDSGPLMAPKQENGPEAESPSRSN